MNKKTVQSSKGFIIFAALAALLGVFLVVQGVQPYVSSIQALKSQETALRELEGDWEQQNLATTRESPKKSLERNTAAPQLKAGESYATVTVPRFGLNYKKVLLQGDSSSQEATNQLLNSGNLVHYSSTAQPCEIGNFSISGHRTGWGGVLRPIITFELDDEITVKTASSSCKYKVIAAPFKISRDDSEILTDPLPGENLSGRSLMTITTCEIWDLSKRIVVVLELVE